MFYIEWLFLQRKNKIFLYPVRLTNVLVKTLGQSDMQRLVSPTFSSATIQLSRWLCFLLSWSVLRTHTLTFLLSKGKARLKEQYLMVSGLLKTCYSAISSSVSALSRELEAESYIYILCLCYGSRCKPDVHLWTFPLNCFSSPCPMPSICIALVT